MQSFKLQSAMEYLMTYSWAILVISLVLVTLFVLGVFKTPVGTQCILPGGFACTSLFLAANGLLNLNLLQATTTPINVTAVGCNSNDTIAHMYAIYNPLATQNTISVPIGANYTFGVQCWVGASKYSSNPGGSFTGYVIINYTDDVSGFPHTLIGQIALSVT